jgi:glycosyltransferase involved in cell wall biosynthesis
MTPLRVLQFITPAGFYGAERWVIALANNAPRDRMICDLAVTQESETQDLSVAEHYPPDAGEVHYLPMSGRFDLRVVAQLVRVIRERQIDVIHTHGYKSDILGWLAARRAGIRCVSTPHGFSGNVGFKLRMFIRIGTYMLRHFDAVAPLSEELVDDMERFRVPAGKTHFIRNGVDLLDIDRVMATLPALGKDPDNTRTIGFIGQLIPRKGLADLLKAFDQLYRKDSGLRLELLGDGRQREELEQLAHSLPSGKAIRFLGFRSDRLERLARFDLFVMTSSLEGIPRCLMEAMAVRVPVVAYDIPGVDQLIEHGITGLLAPHGDISELATQCQTLLSNPELADRLTDAGRDRIDTQYSAARMASEYEQLFLRTLNRSSLGRAESREVG